MNQDERYTYKEIADELAKQRYTANDTLPGTYTLKSAFKRAERIGKGTRGPSEKSYRDDAARQRLRDKVAREQSDQKGLSSEARRPPKAEVVETAKTKDLDDLYNLSHPFNLEENIRWCQGNLGFTPNPKSGIILLDPSGRGPPIHNDKRDQIKERLQQRILQKQTPSLIDRTCEVPQVSPPHFAPRESKKGLKRLKKLQYKKYERVIEPESDEKGQKF